MIHIKLFKIFCVKEVPIYSRETRNMLKSLIQEWEQALNGDQNPYLVNIVGTHWNTPEGCVSIVFENMNGGSMLNLLQSMGSIPEEILREIAQKVLLAIDYLHNKAKISHNGL